MVVVCLLADYNIGIRLHEEYLYIGAMWIYKLVHVVYCERRIDSLITKLFLYDNDHISRGIIHSHYNKYV